MTQKDSGLSDLQRAYSLKLHQNPLLLVLRDDLVWDNFYPVGNESVLNDLNSNITQPLHAGIGIQGAPATGKTHLLQGAVHAALAAGQSAAYLPFKKFKEYGPESIAGFITLDWLVMDDIDLIAGDLAWETALFETLNYAWSGKCRLLYSVSGLVGNAGWQLPDLASRLGWGLVCTLHELDDAHKVGWLIFRSRRRGIEMPESVAQWLLTRYSRDIKALYALLVKLDEASLQAQRRLTLPFVKSVIDVMSE